MAKKIPKRMIEEYMRQHQEKTLPELERKKRSVQARWNKKLLYEGPACDYLKEMWEIQALDNLITQHYEQTITAPAENI